MCLKAINVVSGNRASPAEVTVCRPSETNTTVSFARDEMFATAACMPVCERKRYERARIYWNGKHSTESTVDGRSVVVPETAVATKATADRNTTTAERTAAQWIERGLLALRSER